MGPKKKFTTNQSSLYPGFDIVGFDCTYNFCFLPQNELIVQEPRRRTQTRRFGTDDIIDLSELESSDEDDENISSRTRGSKKGSKKGKRGRDDDDFMDDLPPGNWTRAECYKMEKGLLTFG